MELKDRVLRKLGSKPAQRPVVIKITDHNTKSCGNCAHHRRNTVGMFNVCMHFPAADIHEVNNKVCTVSERKHWSPIQRGLLGRFFHWLF